MSSYWNRGSSWQHSQDQWRNSWTSPSDPGNSWNQSGGPQEVAHPAIDIPSSWQQTSTHFDETPVYGHRFFRVIQPTAWSRKRGLSGTNPLTVPIGLLTRHGAAEFALRALSEGRFVGIVCTRSIPESVLLSQFLKGLRDAGHDIDAVAESLHRKNNPNVSPPSKVDRPCDFMQPLVQVLLDAIAQVAPAKQDTVAMRQLQDMQAQLHAAQEKLRRAGMEVTPDRTRP